MEAVTSQRNKTLMKLISDVAGDLADLATWPDSQATKEVSDKSFKALRDELKSSGYPHGFTYMIMIQIASEVYGETVNREKATSKNIKQVWIKLGDLLHMDK